ncbi:MAG: histidine kinase [Saprospiraceae bacterium]|nr:histidine kinase [Saprospiraceae bacterium]
MKLRWLTHIAFWLSLSVLYTLVRMAFAAPSDMEYDVATRFFRYWLIEGALLPFKAAPFYLLFYYLIPRYLPSKNTVGIISGLVFIIFMCVVVIRWLTPHVSMAMYGDYPEFNTFSPGRMLYSFTEMIPGFSLASAIKLIKQWTENQKKSTLLQQEKLNAELQYLKSQTNPHFLFNTLNNLYGLSRKNSEHTAPAIMKLSHLFRYMLDECREPFIPIVKEIELIKSYLELESLRYGDRLHLESNFNVSDHTVPITPLILLPFVENAFKHGASESVNDVFIKINLMASPEKIKFQIINSIGNLSPNVKNLGIGLKNIKRQLQLVYPDKHELNIESSTDEYHVTLIILPTSPNTLKRSAMYLNQDLHITTDSL